MRASTVRLRMSEGGMWASEGGWVQCFRVACGPPRPERCRLMLKRDPRTDKGRCSSVAHGAKTVASGGRWVKCAARFAVPAVTDQARNNFNDRFGQVLTETLRVLKNDCGFFTPSS